MGKALYRKYRSKSLAEIIGQEHVTETLDHALKQGNISHAYLFTGPRGTGKTSIARILANAVNNLPYNDEQPHLDIIEIDAASNRRIDEIRELKDRVHIAPTSAKYKVYIIDEVHMLTKEAFNALLKTLEEPPDHVIFILATTEAHKVPETIISRTQRFTFKPVPIEKVAAHLKKIAKQENIAIDDAALQLVAVHGEGSLRDSISLLDQIRHTSDKISLQSVQEALGQAPGSLLEQFIQAISQGNLAMAADVIGSLQSQGVQAPQAARQLSQLLRQEILKPRPRVPAAQALQLLHQLLTVPAASDPSLKLELAIYESVLSNSNAPQPIQNGGKTAVASEPKSQPVETTKPVAANPAPEPKMPSSNIKPSALNADTWAQVLSAVKAKHNTLYGIVRMGIPDFEGDKLTLVFTFGFHYKRLNDVKNKQLLAKIIRDITGQDIIVDCVLDTKAIAPELPKPLAVAPDDSNLDLEAISNIFGSAEVVE